MTPTIRPARGLWAAVSPEGEIDVDSVRASELAIKVSCCGAWPALAACGWRIIRVDVIPHEGSDQL